MPKNMPKIVLSGEEFIGIMENKAQFSIHIQPGQPDKLLLDLIDRRYEIAVDSNKAFTGNEAKIEDDYLFVSPEIYLQLRHEDWPFAKIKQLQILIPAKSK
jgi:hypothetical protein